MHRPRYAANGAQGEIREVPTPSGFANLFSSGRVPSRPPPPNGSDLSNQRPTAGERDVRLPPGEPTTVLRDRRAISVPSGLLRRFQDLRPARDPPRRSILRGTCA